MPKSNELQKQASEVLARARAVYDKADAAAKSEKRDITKEENEAFNSAMAEYDTLKARAADAKRLEDAEAAQNEAEARATSGNSSEQRPGTSPVDGRVTDADLGEALRGWALNTLDPDKVTQRHIDAAKRLGVSLRAKEFGIKLHDTGAMRAMQENYRRYSQSAAYRENRALSTQIGASGGFTIAPNFNASIESALLYYGPMMQTSEIIRTATSADLPFMTDNETTKTGSYVGQNTAITTAEGVTFAQTVFKSYKATTNAILIPNELFRDSSLNLNQYLADKLGERLGRFINTETTTGAVKVRGIVGRSTTGVTAASTTTFTADELLGLVHSVDVAYRQGAAFMMHDNSVLIARKLKDGAGGYIWSDGFQAGQPDRLLGFPVFVNNDMDSSLASGDKSIVFGQLNRYKIRMVDDIRITMTDQRYWEYDQMGFAAYVEFDGDLLNAGTNPVKAMAH